MPANAVDKSPKIHFLFLTKSRGETLASLLFLDIPEKWGVLDPPAHAMSFLFGHWMNLSKILGGQRDSAGIKDQTLNSVDSSSIASTM